MATRIPLVPKKPGPVIVNVIKQPGTGRVTITGPYGVKNCRDRDPVDIGLAVVEVMTGQMLCPPANHRKEEGNG